jgi:hypothetical protein
VTYTTGPTGDYRLALRVNDGQRWSEQATVHFSVAVLGPSAQVYAQDNGAVNSFSPSIRVNSDASAMMAFRPDQNPDGSGPAHVRIGKCSGPDCNQQASWTTAAVDCSSGGDPALGPSLNRFSDDPLSYEVSYIKAGADDDVYFARCTGASCFNAPGAGCVLGTGSSRVDVTGGNDSAQLATALAQARSPGAAGSNNLWIAYQAGTGAAPPLGVAYCPGGGACAWCAPAAGGGRIDTTGGTTGAGDFQIGLHAAPDGAGSDVLTAAYRRAPGGDGDLMFATCTHTINTCGTGAGSCLSEANWTRITVDGGVNRGRYAAIWRTPCNAPNEAGRIHISYIEGAGGAAGAKNIRYATCRDAGATCPQVGSCTNPANWSNVAVASMPDGIPGTSMHVSPLDGLARIATHHHTGALGLRLLTNRLSVACAFDINNWAQSDVVCGNAGHEPSIFVHTDGKTRVGHSQGTGPPYDIYFYAP